MSHFVSDVPRRLRCDSAQRLADGCVWGARNLSARPGPSCCYHHRARSIRLLTTPIVAVVIVTVIISAAGRWALRTVSLVSLLSGLVGQAPGGEERSCPRSPGVPRVGRLSVDGWCRCGCPCSRFSSTCRRESQRACARHARRRSERCGSARADGAPEGAGGGSAQDGLPAAIGRVHVL